MNSGSSSTAQSKNESQTPSNAIENDVNTRVKRIYTDKFTNENNSKVLDVLNIKIKPKGKKEETKNEEEKNEDMEINSNKNNKYDIFKEINEKNIAMFKNKLMELNGIKNEEFKKDECKEFYLISRNWFFKFKNAFKNEYCQRLMELKNNNENNNILLERQIIDKMLFLKDEDKNINIIKPKYAFCSKIYPYHTNKGVWDFLQQVFCLYPEIKIESEKIEKEPGKFIYKRDLLKYIKINCILLPPKKYIYNINEYKIKVIKELQTFSFFFNKYKKVTELSNHLKQIIKQNNINLVDINNYKCWIDLNYFNFDKL